MKIALFAPSLKGHRIYWLKNLLERGSALQIQILVYTVKCKDNTERLNEIELILGKLVVEDCPKNLMTRWKSDVEKDNMLGVCWDADRVLHKFLFISGRYRLLIMRPYLESRSLLGITRYLVKNTLATALRANKSIEVARLSIPYAHKQSTGFHWVRDEFNTEHFLKSIHSAEIPEELSSLTKNHEIISVLGYLDSRKNPVRAYRIVEQLRIKNNKEIFLLFAGVQDQSFKLELLKIDNMQNVIQIDRRLTEAEYKEVIKLSKVILLVYANNGPSGIVLNSLSIGTPVLLQGGRHWSKLEQVLGGTFRVEKSNLRKLKNSLNEIRLQPQQSRIQILSQEPISSLGSFFLGKD